ncbi:hypothetical protein [Microtetraspora malaysiensis]|uniref:hypothetical protein n=1 Tax=Microtetraspora malaysiensis TaxID=161358 RepID=UPI000B0355D3|nr:hypothetical protein [Microtetraspora malaysiensis]
MPTPHAPKQSQPATKAQKGCGCLLLLAVIFALFAACGAIFGDTAPPLPSPSPLPSYAATDLSEPADPAPADTLTPSSSPTDDFDGDGIRDRRDRDADGDGVNKSVDRDDLDPTKGRKPKPKPKPAPRETEDNTPSIISGVNPGGFCGHAGAVGTSNRGRTYICRDGHWRR